jgi:hypothetical protein
MNGIDIFQFDIRRRNENIVTVKVLKQDLDKMRQAVEKLPITIFVRIEELLESKEN